MPDTIVNDDTPAVVYAAAKPYYYLWHLASLGVVDADYGPDAAAPDPCPTIRGTVWDLIGEAYPSATAPAVVAMIDVGASRTHPNLASRVDPQLSIDLVSHRHGAKTHAVAGVGPYTPEGRAAFFAGLSLAGLGPFGLDPQQSAYLDDLVGELAASQGVLRTLIDGDETFASHGTACAGLVVGEPAAGTPADGTVDATSLAGAAPGDATVNPNRNLLPYFGVDPFSRLISIKTGFEPFPDHYITAFLYAWNCKPDVILMPRGIPDPVRSILRPKPELAQNLGQRDSRELADLHARMGEASAAGIEIKPFAVGATAHPDRGWAILEKLIVAISRKIPVVCAAGNDGESQVIYPAKRAAPDNGIVAVGAVTPLGFRSGYSNYGEGLTLVAPSDDSEVYTRHQMRIDHTNPLVAMHHYDAGPGQIVPFSPYQLLTTDLPGTFGYEGGSEPYSSVLPPSANQGTGGGYYTSFGGTSGAAALVAGVAALAARANKARHGVGAVLDGVAMKALLVAACDQNAVVAPGAPPLQPDPMNADDEPAKGKAYYFGAGLLHAGRVVDAVLN